MTGNEQATKALTDILIKEFGKDNLAAKFNKLVENSGLEIFEIGYAINEDGTVDGYDFEYKDKQYSFETFEEAEQGLNSLLI